MSYGRSRPEIVVHYLVERSSLGQDLVASPSLRLLPNSVTPRLKCQPALVKFQWRNGERDVKTTSLQHVQQLRKIDCTGKI